MEYMWLNKPLKWNRFFFPQIEVKHISFSDRNISSSENFLEIHRIL